MSDLIDRQAAIDAVNRVNNSHMELKGMPMLGWCTLLDEIKELPSARPERKKGKWILDEDPHDGDCRCSVCLMAIDQMHERHHRMLNALTGGKWWRFYKFCPNCGADMRGGDAQ